VATIAGHIERFQQHLAGERRLSPLTVSAYRRELDAFAHWCAQQQIDDCARIDGQHVRMFAARSHAGGLQASSVQRRLSALRTFFGYLLREGLVNTNPAVGISAPKAGKRLPHTLDVDQMGRLLSMTPRDALQWRDLAMMELLYSSGLRLAELVGLDLENLSLRPARHHDPRGAPRRRVALGGDGQVTLGNTVMKGNARKVRRLYQRQGAGRLRRRHRRCLHAVRALRGQAREIRQPDARRDRAGQGLAHRPLSAPPRGAAARRRPRGLADHLRQRRCDRARARIVAIGSGGPFAQAAARALLLENTELAARSIVERSLGIAADICIYTNRNLTIESCRSA
jgi:site-specific recombinase XerC